MHEIKISKLQAAKLTKTKDGQRGWLPAYRPDAPVLPYRGRTSHQVVNTSELTTNPSKEIIDDQSPIESQGTSTNNAAGDKRSMVREI